MKRSQRPKQVCIHVCIYFLMGGINTYIVEAWAVEFSCLYVYLLVRGLTCSWCQVSESQESFALLLQDRHEWDYRHTFVHAHVCVHQHAWFVQAFVFALCIACMCMPRHECIHRIVSQYLKWSTDLFLGVYLTCMPISAYAHTCTWKHVAPCVSGHFCRIMSLKGNVRVYMRAYITQYTWTGACMHNTYTKCTYI